jgi:hypothetical protein
MDREVVSALVRETLASYGHEPAPQGSSTIGLPWSAEKLRGYLERLEGALVEPYLQRFELQETYEEIRQPGLSFADYWVVTEIGNYLEWYDPNTGQFGLGQHCGGSALPISVGVRSDLLGVFCAM